MNSKTKLIWKLSAVFAAILAAAITLSGCLNDRICDHYSLESARTFLRFNSESIIKGIGRLMMSRDNEGIEELIVELSRDSEVYGDIRLVSHPSGNVVASRFDGDRTILEQGDPVCATCHYRDDLSGVDLGAADSVVEGPAGERILSVTAPILNEPGCRDAECHAHAGSPPVLGFLSADYSLRGIDTMVTDRRALIGGTVLASLLLGFIALRLMFTQLLERPINRLISGTNRIAANQLDFRFDRKRNDEIGLLEESFNTMTATLQANQEELRSAKEYVEGIVENSADIIITVTPQELIQTFNHGAEQTLGYERDEVIGKRIGILFADPGDRDLAIARLNDTDNVRNYETRFLSKDGQTRDVLLTLSRLRDRKGNSIGTFGISKDITREKKLLRELVQSKKFAAIGQAVTGIQHAIKNMLSSLTGGAYLVRSGLVKDNRQRIEEGWRMVEEGMKQITDLSRSMLDYAREWKPRLQRVDLNESMAKICQLNRETAAGQGVTLRCEVADDVPAVLCDPKLIEMTATDSLVNAIDACTCKDYRPGETPEVVLTNSLTEGRDYFVIEVRDNGCGMNEEIRRAAFTPFFSTKESRGTGLGLAMAARNITLHKGEISVESEPGRGTILRFLLPIDGPDKNREPIDGQADSDN